MRGSTRALEWDGYGARELGASGMGARALSDASAPDRMSGR
jgi:hypothetical protein